MGLLDVLQSASNAVAGNVAGPVDLLSFALRKAGIPIPEDALGGSEWMKRKGLMRDVPKGAEQVVGETLGLLAPTAIAANAPKIARGLLQVQENAAAPRMLHPETGAIVWHGSPHKFDKFDASKIGTGEGGQAYGHGLYLAENPKTALSYKNDLATQIDVGGATLLKGNKKVGTTGSASVDDLLLAHNGDVDKAIQFVKSAMKDGRASRRGYAPELAMLEAMRPTVKTHNTGTLYKADIPDEWLPKMLDWDKPLNQQSKDIQAALGVKVRDFDAELALLDKAQRAGKSITEFPEYQQLTKLIDDSWRFKQDSGADLYRQFGKPFEAANRLKDLGIPGIRYLDGSSRGAGQGTSNFVIFPGLEDQIKILERNGVPLGLLTP